MTSSVLSFAYFAHFSNLTLELMQVFANGKQCFSSFIEFSDTPQVAQAQYMSSLLHHRHSYSSAIST